MDHIIKSKYCMRHFGCTSPQHIDIPRKPKAFLRHRRFNTEFTVESSVLYGRDGIDADKQSLLTEDFNFSEHCKTENVDCKNSARLQTEPSKPSHSRQVKSMNFQLISH